MEDQSSQQTSRCLNTCSEQNGLLPTLPNAQPVLQYGNPYTAQETRGYSSICLLGISWLKEFWNQRADGCTAPDIIYK